MDAKDLSHTERRVSVNIKLAHPTSRMFGLHGDTKCDTSVVLPLPIASGTSEAMDASGMHCSIRPWQTYPSPQVSALAFQKRIPRAIRLPMVGCMGQ